MDEKGLCTINPYNDTKEVVKEEPFIWRAKLNHPYYILSSDGEIYREIEHGTKYDCNRFLIGNYFESENDAINMKQYLKIRRKLMMYSESPDRPWDGQTRHYHIQYRVVEKDVNIAVVTNSYCPGEIYFDSKEIAERAIEIIGKDRLLKIYFNR